jgi:uncharacterized protein (DUF433 family)
MERLPKSSPWYAYVLVDTDRLGGDPVFRGTRVPIRALFDYLKGGHELATFLDHFEGVTLEQAKAVIELAGGGLAHELRAA